MSEETKRRRRLIQLKRDHGLTYAGIAELAGEGTSIKTVESWMSTPGTAGHRPIPAYRLELIELRLQLAKTKEVKQ